MDGNRKHLERIIMKKALYIVEYDNGDGETMADYFIGEDSEKNPHEVARAELRQMHLLEENETEWFEIERVTKIEDEHIIAVAKSYGMKMS